MRRAWKEKSARKFLSTSEEHDLQLDDNFSNNRRSRSSSSSSSWQRTMKVILKLMITTASIILVTDRTNRDTHGGDTPL